MTLGELGFRKTAYKLQPHQERALRKFEKSDKLLLYHGLGSGKTLTALVAGEKAKKPVTVIGPAALKHNFPGERRKHGVKTRLKYYSYAKPPKKKEHEILVFDEAHRMGRVEAKRSKYPDVYKGKKTLLMTGTPIRNEPRELVPILRGLGIPMARDVATFKKAFIQETKQHPSIVGRLRGVKPGIIRGGKNLGALKRTVKGKVDYHAPSKEDYPEVTSKRVEVEMGPGQFKAYRMALKGQASLAYKIKHGIAPSKAESRRLNAFMQATRQISNIPGGYNLSSKTEDAPKITRAVKEIEGRIETDPHYKGVTYSTYLKHGVTPISKALTAKEIPHGMFIGGMSKKKRAEVIKAFNKGDIKHLLISGAGAEGIDLKGTKLIQLLEPHWNEPQLEQVRGRAIRYKSHAHLPKKHRKVEVQRYIAVPRERGKWFWKGRNKGTDEYLEMLSKQKKALSEQFLGILREAGKETG